VRKVFAFILAAVLVPSGLVIAAATKKKPSSSSKKSSTAAKKSSSTAKKSTPTARKTTTAKKKPSSKSSKKTAAKSTWRNRQLQPTPDRYRDIQQALKDKGYLESDPTGKWDQASVDALRRFQQEQNLEASGKIDSLSLIALGLGPKYDTAAVAAAPPPVPRPPL
jgi:hypothetical protein